GLAHHVLRIRALVERIEPYPVADAIHQPRLVFIGGSIVDWIDRCWVERDADLPAIDRVADDIDRRAVHPKQVVRGCETGGAAGLARRVDTPPVAEKGGAEGFVDRDPVAHAIPETPGDRLGVLAEGARDVTV